MNNFPSDDTHITSIHTLYSQLKIYPQSSQYTVLSAFYLTSSTSRDCKIISIGTGTKCLPKCRLPIQGEAVHDSHAEILARRGAIRWLLEEILHYRVGGSQWIERQAGVYRFREGIHLHMYISTVPCGDASTRFLAASQDPEMASMKNSAAVSHDEGTAARGRNNYNLFNVLRTKPGRADSPPTLSLSCSDKIASWSWLGIQGAFGATFFTQGIYIRKIVIGEVLSSKDSELVEAVSGDCERALSGRLDGLLTTGKEPYSLHKPVIAFTPIPFVHSRLVVGLGTASTSSNDSLCWYAAPAPGPLLPSSFPVSHTEKEETAKTLLSYDNGSQNHSNSSSAGTVQVLINGYKRGVSPKHRTTLNNVKFLPKLSKLSIFKLYARVYLEVYGTEIPSIVSYHDVKTGLFDSCYTQIDHQYSVLPSQSVCAYYKAKILLKGPSGPFNAWWDMKSCSAIPALLLKSGPEYIKSSGSQEKREQREGAGSEVEKSIQKTEEERHDIRGCGHWERFNVDGELV